MPGILFILTGGTIDSFADNYQGISLFSENHQSFIPDYIDSQKLYDDCDFYEVCMKDSDDVDDADRQEICDVIDASDSVRIIITHGTDTMVETALYLKKNCKAKNKTIYLTGSMSPLESDFSDGGFNLGYAVAVSESAAAGVYIVMHGRLFAGGNVRKNIDNMRFEEIK